jgi:hypothetical protein
MMLPNREIAVDKLSRVTPLRAQTILTQFVIIKIIIFQDKHSTRV